MSSVVWFHISVCICDCNNYECWLGVDML